MEEIVQAPDIWFPNIGISFENVNKVAISNFLGLGLDIYWYGIIIAFGILAGLFVARYEAGRTGQKKEIYTDYLLWTIVFCVIGARLYYVIFRWDSFKDNLWNIFAIRNGGLAIYGGIIAAIIVSVIYTRVRKISLAKFLDTAVFGLIIGQVIGRWGNFINREAFGGYTDSFFAMRYKVEQIKETSEEVLNNLKEFKVAGTEEIVKYIQVHPTFFYESMWNIGLFIIMSLYKRHKKFDGEMVSMYFVGYGIGRFWIEGLRTDQLIIGDTGIAVSQALSFVLALFFFFFIIYKIRKKRGHMFLR